MAAVEMRELLLLGEPEPRSARAILNEFVREALATGEPSDAEELTRKAQAELAHDPEFGPVAASQYVAEWLPRLIADEAHRTRTPGGLRRGLSEEAYRKAVARKWEIFRISVGSGRTKLLLDCSRPELAVDLAQRRKQLAENTRYVRMEQHFYRGLQDDRTTIRKAFDEGERFEIWDTYLGKD